MASPSEVELTKVLLELKQEQPTLGITKLHALLLSQHPEWVVSEKRTRKILQHEGLVNNAAQPFIPGKKYPSSRVIDNLDLEKFSKKIEVRFFNKVKGKGLVAKEKIAEGEVLWKEDPYILAPEWDMYDLMRESRACGHCGTPFNSDNLSLVVNCPADSVAHCASRFCNRLCLSRSTAVHPLLCPSQNPASIPLLTFSRKNQWMALHAVSQIASKILLANQRDEETLKADWGVLQGIARLHMEDRYKNSGLDGEPLRETWKTAHKLFCAAFKEPPEPQDKKKLARTLRKPLPKEIDDGLFDYENFLTSLGSMSLNLESHGGLYTLHSHLNHNCAPNISIRHLDKQKALARITVLALKDIEPGQELLLTYVNPQGNLKTRRNALKEWAFGTCMCERCVEEEKTFKEDESVPPELDGLEEELKASLGVR